MSQSVVDVFCSCTFLFYIRPNVVVLTNNSKYFMCTLLINNNRYKIILPSLIGCGKPYEPEFGKWDCIKYQ